jgi:hypothetical protein
LAHAPVSRAARAAILAPIVIAALGPASAASGQGSQPRLPPRPEVRIDYLGTRPHTVHAGLGINVPAGTYVRVGLIGAGGASWREGRTTGSARADVITRFMFDPFRERRWGLSAGGGVSVRYDGDTFDGRRRWRTLIALLLDLEGPRSGGVAPAFALGLGGGIRAGVLLRSAAAGRR